MQESIRKIKAEKSGMRLDIFLKESFPDFSRTFLKKLIREGKVKVGGVIKKPSHLLKEGEEVEVGIPCVEKEKIEPQQIELPILFEDEHLLVIDKPAGISVHPVFAGQKGTVVNALLSHTGKLSTVAGPLRPGIVHRLDRDTSGVMVVAKEDEVHIALSMQFKKREVEKIYLGIVRGIPPEKEGRIDVRIGRSFKSRIKMIQEGRSARDAITCYKLLKVWGKWSLLEIRPLTGRTHQIRVHLRHLNCFLVGDRMYGGKPAKDFPFPVSRTMLHAKSLAFFHPVKKEWMKFEASVPSDMKNIINYLEREYEVEK